LIKLDKRSLLFLYLAGDDELINLWDITASSSRPVKTLAGHSASIVALRFFSDLLVSGSFYGDLKIWVINSSFAGPVHFEREAHDLGVTCVDVLSPSATENHHHHHHPPHLIASGGNDNHVKIWHCSSSKHQLTHVRTFKKHTCAVMCVSFGIKHYLASGSGDKTIIIWNYETGHFIHQFNAHTRYVTCCSFSSDGHYLASGSNDRMVNIWKIDYHENENENEEKEHKKSKIQQLQLNSIDQWTNEMVAQWLEQFNIKTKLKLTGNDLLLKSDNEILDLFNNNEQLLNELSSLRHTHFIKQISLKKTNHVADESNQPAIPNEFLCPITHELMNDPVCVSDGYTYERKAIEEWLTKKQTSPIMNVSIKGTQLYPNKILKMLIDQYEQQR
jgi:WD40 repeat protein